MMHTHRFIYIFYFIFFFSIKYCAADVCIYVQVH